MYEKVCVPQSCQHTNTNGGMWMPQTQSCQFGEALSGVGSQLLKTELGAYGEKILDSGSAYMQTNVRLSLFRSLFLSFSRIHLP